MDTPDNPFLRRIAAGEIADLAALKHAYRARVRETHPDSAGSDRLVGEFIACRAHYEEARQFLADRGPGGDAGAGDDAAGNWRWRYFVSLLRFEAQTSPFVFHWNKTAEAKAAAEAVAREAFARWQPERIESYDAAMEEYAAVRGEKRRNIHAMLYRPNLHAQLLPVFFNLAKYHLTGLAFYRSQLKRNMDGVLARLADEGRDRLREFLLFLVADADAGPALEDG